MATLGQRANRIVRGSQNLNMTNEQFLLHTQTDMGEHVRQKLMGYAAELHVLGVIAGVVAGPRQQYLDAIKKAAGGYFHQLRERSKRTSWVDSLNPLNIAADSIGYVYDVFGLIPGRLGKDWGEIGHTLHQTDWDKAVDTALADYLSGVVSSCKARWDEFWKDFDHKGLLFAYGKLQIDADFLVAEMAITVALSVATDGVAAGIRIVGRRIAAEVTEVVVRAVSLGSRGVPESGVLIKTVIKDAEINPRIVHEVLNEEKLGLGSDRQSVGARAEKPVDPVQKPAGEAVALSNQALGEAAEKRARQDLVGQGYTETVSVTNKSGQGLDVVGRNPTTGDVKVVEVKANGSDLNPRQAEGGPANTQRVITEAAQSKSDNWAGAQADAQKVRGWLENAPERKYEIWKYEVDRVSGDVSQPRSASWNWTVKPRRVTYRDGLTPIGSEQAAPPMNLNPATGPPPIQPH